MTNAEKYAELRAEINFKLLLISQKLAVHKKEHLLKPRDWSYTGDLQKVNDDLTNIVEFLKAQ